MDKLTKYCGLGIGYNVMIAFPFGAEDTNLDPGFMSPLIKFTFNNENINGSTSKMPIPDGVWNRRDYACRENKMVNVNKKSRIIDSNKTLKKVISEDITTSLVLGPIGFTNHLEFKKLEYMIKNENYITLIYKSLCASTSLGLLLTHEWLVVDSFKSAVEKLPKIFKGFDTDFECKYDSYADLDNEICTIWIKPWLDFFNDFGTHFITRVVLGGKLINITNKKVETKLNKANETYSNDTHADLSLGTVDLTYKSNNDNFDLSKSNDNKDSYYVTGGNPGIIFQDKDNFKEWSKTVKDNQMPIKFDITPLSELLPSRKLKLEYWKALKYYKLYITNKMQ